MRIAGGLYKSRIIKAPRNSSIRPTTEKTREALFSALGEDILEAEIADLFCGSGALGLEALSRGASRAFFVDNNHGATAAVRENIEKLGLAGKSKVMTMNVFNIRPRLLNGVDIIFADPPYGRGYALRLSTLLSLPKIDWHGILILEHESDWEYEGDKYRHLKRISFGETSVSFLLRERPIDIAAGNKKGKGDG
jgi:16S rRNA (guanine966-N2)-methyltransferase